MISTVEPESVSARSATFERISFWFGPFITRRSSTTTDKTQGSFRVELTLTILKNGEKATSDSTASLIALMAGSTLTTR